MLKLLPTTFKLALAISALAPVLGQACNQSSDATASVNRRYDGIASLPVRSLLNLDSTCNGRELKKVVLWASAQEGLARATLIVNGLPVGVTQIMSTGVDRYVFDLDENNDRLGNQVQSIEIRISGEVYVERIEGSLSEAHTTIDDDIWGESHQDVIGMSVAAGHTPIHDTVFVAGQEGKPFYGLLVIARDDAFHLLKLTVHYADGQSENYGPALIAENERRIVKFSDWRMISSVEVEGKQGRLLGDRARLEVRGIR